MSEHESKLPPGESPRWLDHAANRNKVFWAVVALYALTAVAGFLPYEHHPHFDFEALPVFPALFGLMCSIGLVLGAAWLRGPLMREEDYYDDE